MPTPPPVSRQIDEAIERRARTNDDRFIAYFQPATNTHAPMPLLRELWTEALVHPAIVGLAIGTRPDCVDDDVLELLARLARHHWVSIEYGVQTIHDRTLAWMDRGHDYAAVLDAVARTRARAQRGTLRVGVHLILGLPGESRRDTQATAHEMARLRIDSVKLHNLYVARDTRLAELHGQGRLALPDRAEYVTLVVDVLERLPPDCVIERLTADAPPEYLLAPDWCRDKSAVRRAIELELQHRGTFQGAAMEIS